MESIGIKDTERRLEELKKANAKLRRRFAEFATLHETSQMINATKKREVMLDLVMKSLTIFLGVEVCCLLFRHEENPSEFSAIQAHGLSEQTKQNFRITLGQSIIGTVVQSGESCFIPNYDKDPAFIQGFAQEDKNKVKTFLCYPLKTLGEVVGILLILRLGPEDEFGEEQQGLFSIIAAQIAAPIELARRGVG